MRSRPGVSSVSDRGRSSVVAALPASTFHGADTISGYQRGVDRLLIGDALLDDNPAAFIRDHMSKTATGVVLDFGNAGRIVINGPNLTVAGVTDDIFSI